MENADVALNHEGQQYSRLDEASAVTRTPRRYLVIWCGDHKRTSGGLRIFFLARSCLGQVPGGAPFSQRSELATACTNRMQIKN